MRRPSPTHEQAGRLQSSLAGLNRSIGVCGDACELPLEPQIEAMHSQYDEPPPSPSPSNLDPHPHPHPHIEPQIEAMHSQSTKPMTLPPLEHQQLTLTLCLSLALTPTPNPAHA